MGSIAISGYGHINSADLQIIDGSAPDSNGPFNLVDGSGDHLVTGTGENLVTG
jgi:hypothetical protein